MPIRRRASRLVVFAVLVAAAHACGGGDGGLIVGPTSVVIKPSTLALVEGATGTLTATVVGGSAGDTAVAWTTSAAGVATVSGSGPTGTITAVAPGTATIRAVAGNVAATATITVTAAPVASIALSPDTATLVVGSSRQLVATVKDSAGRVLQGRGVTWSSSLSSIAFVSATGLVSALNPGTATITAASEGKTATASIIVNPVPTASVAVAPTSASLKVGDTQQLTATLKDSAGNVLIGRTPAWTSSATDVATVTATGLVTARGAGTATISATSDGRSAAATIVVTALPIASVVVGGADQIVVGSTVTLAANPRDSTGASLPSKTCGSWTSSDTTIARVDTAGRVTGVAVGGASITVTCGRVTGSKAITVIPVPVASVTVSPATVSLLAGGTQTLLVTLRDSTGATLVGRHVVWSSSNTAVATVTGDSTSATLTAIAVGTTTISATAEGIVGSAAVTVNQVTSVKVTPTSIAMNGLGRSTIVTATVSGPQGPVTGASPTWTSDNPAVATVSGSGTTATVTSVGPGTTTIRATVSGVVGTSSVVVTAVAAVAQWSGQQYGGPLLGTVLSVWGTTASDVFAIDGNSNVWHWNGTQWAFQTGCCSPRALWGSGGSDVWAVGDGIIHYDGTAWTRVVDASATPYLRSVSGSGASSAFAVGDSGAVLQWNGGAWTRVASLTTATLTGVWAADAGTAFVVGDSGIVLRYASGGWSRQSVGTTRPLLAVWGTSSTNVYATDADGKLWQWNGVSWTQANVLFPEAILQLSGTGPADVYAMGLHSLYHFNGTAWSSVATGYDISGANVRTFSLWEAPGGAVFVGGDIGLVFRYQSGSVATLSFAPTFYGVTVPSGSSAYIVGEAGTTLRFNGSAWVSMTKGTNATLRGVWAASPTAVFAVGYTGTILKSTSSGTAWTPMSSGTAADLYGVWGSSATSLFAVGANGAILQSNGSTWTGATSGTTASLYAVSGTSPTNAFAVGAHGTILHWDGTAWSAMASGTTATLYGVWAGDASTAFAVGENGTILRFNGSTWSPMTAGTAATLLGVWGSSAADVYAVGSGAIMHWDGTAWKPMSSSGSGWYYLAGIAGPVTGGAVAVGSPSIIVTGVATSGAR